MPVRLGSVKKSGGLAFLHTCEICGDCAYFGVDVNLDKALFAVERKKFSLAKKLLGKWYCLIHWRILNENNQKTVLLA